MHWDHYGDGRMNDRDALVAVVTEAHDDLDRWLGEARPEPAAPSALPGWTVGHVLTHLARNADGLAGIVEGAAHGERRAMYPHGAAGREADIEAGAARSLDELRADVRDAGARLAAGWAALDGLGWQGSGIALSGERPVADTPLLRAAEVTVHRFDIDPEHTHDRWPALYVRHDLRRMSMIWSSRRSLGLAELPAAIQRLPDATRLAWLYGRVEIEGVERAALGW